MKKYNLRLHFEKELSKTISIESDNNKSALEYVTGHKEWFYPDEATAIDMRKVSYITTVKPGGPIKNNPF